MSHPVVSISVDQGPKHEPQQLEIYWQSRRRRHELDRTKLADV